MKPLLALAGSWLIGALIHGAAFAAPLPYNQPDARINEQEGIVQRTTAFWIGMPDNDNAMPFLNIAAGTKIQILGSEKAYYRVKHKSLIGFVEQRNVKIVDPDHPEAAMPKAVEVNELTEKGSNAYRVTKATSLRVQPDSRARVLLRLQAEDRLEVLDDSGRWWWRVRYKDKLGWAKAALLEKQ